MNKKQIIQHTRVLKKAVRIVSVVSNLEKAFETSVPQQFYGTCYSVDHAWQNPTEGGTMYYHPRKGGRVLVTISRGNGSITRFTDLPDQLEKKLNKNSFKQIGFSMGHAVVMLPLP